jgi:hypothetical protein
VIAMWTDGIDRAVAVGSVGKFARLGEGKNHFRFPLGWMLQGEQTISAIPEKTLGTILGFAKWTHLL